MLLFFFNEVAYTDWRMGEGGIVSVKTLEDNEGQPNWERSSQHQEWSGAKRGHVLAA